MKHILKAILNAFPAWFALSFYPLVAHAQLFGCPQVVDFRSFVTVMFCQIIDPLVTLIIALALVFFLWGGAQFIMYADNEQKRAEGKQKMVWGIIALFIMVSIWGVVYVLQNTFFGGAPVGAPVFPSGFPN